MSKLSIPEIGKTWGDVQRLRSSIQDTLTKDGLIFCTTKHQLCFHSLQCFDLDEYPKFRDLEGIARVCAAILRALGKGSVASDLESLDTFVKQALGFAVLPSAKREELRDEVAKDIKVIDNILNDYRADPVGKQVISGQSPRNQVGRTIAEFIRRCEVEKRELVDYYFHRLDSDAIRFATIEHQELLRMVPLVMGIKIPVESVVEHYDYRQIDRCGHRLLSIDAADGNEMREIYKAGDWQEFYRRLSKRIPPESVFADVKNVITCHPELQRRSPILDELELLYREKRYISFYALALPQVEGLFSEMLNVLGLERPKRNALPDKVEAVRPSYFLSHATFDYYEYVLPEERNQFAHLGYTERTEWRSLDLLYDLHHLFEVWASLDAPIILLRNLFKEKDLSKSFRSIQVYLTLFDLLEQLPPSVHDEEVLGYKRRIFAEVDLGGVIGDAEAAASATVEALRTCLLSSTGADLVEISKKEVIARKIELMDALSKIVEFDDESLRALEGVRRFVEGLPTHLESLLPEHRLRLQAITESYGEQWKKVELLRPGKKD